MKPKLSFQYCQRNMLLCYFQFNNVNRREAAQITNSLLIFGPSVCLSLVAGRYVENVRVHGMSHYTWKLSASMMVWWSTYQHDFCLLWMPFLFSFCACWLSVGIDLIGVHFTFEQNLSQAEPYYFWTPQNFSQTCLETRSRSDGSLSPTMRNISVP